jgi:hypothetical protein
MLCSLESVWNQLLEKIPKAYNDCYFKEEFLRLYENTGKAMCFVCTERDNIFLFPFITNKYSYKGQEYWDFESQYGYGGPITNCNDSMFIQKVQQEFIVFMKDNGFIAGLVKFHPLLNNYNLLSNCATLYFNRNTIGIDLTQDIETIWHEHIHSKHRNSIRKAEKSGLKYFVDNEFKHYDEFKQLYFNTMERNHADEFYFFNNAYFESFKNKFIGASFLGHVIFEDKIISSSIFFFSNDYAHYHLSGSNVNFLSLNPNCFLLFKTMEYFKTLDKKIFHLGGGTDPSEKNSLFLFKARFSHKRYDFYIGEVIFNRSLYDNICNDWTKSNPEKAILYKDKLLKYRF